MARIAYCWELGGSIGHVTSGVRLSQALEGRGHETVLLLRELHHLLLVPDGEAATALQAPVLPETPDTPTPSTYVDLLRGSGYGDPKVLAAHIGAWMALLRECRTDLVIADFAPTALLAARVLGIRRATYGNGFSVPPLSSPLPPFRLGTTAGGFEAAHAEARVLESVNGALAAFKSGPLARLSQLFEADEHFLCTLPELDHYGNRERSGYWGPRLVTDVGASHHWPGGRGKRVLVYLQAGYERLDEMLAAIAARQLTAIATIPNLDAARHASFQQGPRRLVEGFARLENLFKDCDLLICHGGDIAAGALMHGVPSLVIAQHYEQLLTAMRLVALGVALTPSKPAVAGELPKLLDQLLTDPGFKSRSRAFTARYRGFDTREQRRRVVARIEQILAG